MIYINHLFSRIRASQFQIKKSFGPGLNKKRIRSECLANYIGSEVDSDSKIFLKNGLGAKSDLNI